MKNRFKYYFLGMFFLIFQVISVIYSQFIPERFFCWRPYDSHTYYEIKVEIDNNLISEQKIRNRYRYQPKGWEPRSVHNIISIVSQYESTYGKNDFAKISIEYSENGKETKIWKLNH